MFQTSGNARKAQIPLLSKDDLLTQLIGHSDFYITVKKLSTLDRQEWLGKVGIFSLTLCALADEFQPNQLVPDVDAFHMYITHNKPELLLYYDLFEYSNGEKRRVVMYYGAVCELPYSVFEAFKSKHVQLVRGHYIPETCQMEISVRTSPI